MLRTKSEAIYKKSCLVIPGGVNSPVRSFKGLGMPPLIVESGAGDQIQDADGNRYIDYCLSWGPLILGHADPGVVKAACEQMAKGSSFGIATEVEEKLATKIVGLYPSIEKIRFVSSGTEATMTALRIARGALERPKIVKFIGNYHGHHDALLVQAGSGVASLNPLATSKGVNLGTISDTLLFHFNDFAAVRSFFRTNKMAEQVAAVIIEPIAGNMGVVPPEPGFLQMLREETARVGALLIFDEVITGFRVGLKGAQALYGIDPDITCFGKVIGGGFPVAGIGGKAKYMDHLAPLGQVYQAGTLSGNPVAMRAGLETLQRIEQPGFYEMLFAKTERLVGPIRKSIEKKNADACIQCVGSMFTLFFGPKKVASKLDLKGLDEERFARFFKYLFERGVYIPPASQEAWFLSSAHTEEHIDYTAACICKFIEEGL
ncbi:MAG: glutamate-1-semialdehyde 2,1-aminomutase [Verrucomicrobia bacterium]|nr:glutamate-1-semialdehyde 2,1-aminomutase [Verrucomicrobiota bacterium]